MAGALPTKSTWSFDDTAPDANLIAMASFDVPGGPESSRTWPAGKPSPSSLSSGTHDERNLLLTETNSAAERPSSGVKDDMAHGMRDLSPQVTGF